MKKLLFAFLLFFCGVTLANASLYKHRLGMYMMVDGVRQEVIFYEDSETGMPVFRTSYETMLSKESDYVETDSIDLTEEEEYKIKMILETIIEGKIYLEHDWLHLVGAQTLIWEVLENHFTTSYTYNFTTPFLDEYRERVNKKLEEKQPDVYHYETTLGESYKLAFLPKFKEPYQIIPLGNDAEITELENEFVITPKGIGTFEFLVDSTYFDEEVKYFTNQSTEIIELVKPAIPNSIVSLNVKASPKKSHRVTVINSDGIQLNLEKNTYLEQEEVTFSYMLDDGYVLDFIQVKDLNGKEIGIENQTFQMPDDDVIIEAHASKERKYFITSFVSEGVFLNIPPMVNPGDEVDIQMTILSNYELEQFKIQTLDGKNIFVNHGKFIMPESDVSIYVTARKIPDYHIYYKKQEGIEISIFDKAFQGETVSFDYKIDSNYELESLQVKSTRGEVIPFNKNTFVMPESDVVLEVSLKKKQVLKEKEYSIFVVNTEGINVLGKNLAKKNETISFDFTTDDKYELLSFDVFTTKGEKVEVLKNTFVMPDSDIFVLPRVKKVEQKSYNIKIRKDDSIEVLVKSNAYSEEPVSFSYLVKDGYELQSVEAKNALGEMIPIQNQSFTMPLSDVTISFQTKKIEKIENSMKDETLYSVKDGNLHYEVPNTKKNLKFYPILFFFVSIVLIFLSKRKLNSICKNV